MRGLFLVGKFPLSPSHSSFSDTDNDSVGRKRRRKSLKVKMGRRKNSFWQPNSDFNHFSQYVPLVYINLCIKNSKLTLNSIIYLSMLLCGINKKNLPKIFRALMSSYCFDWKISSLIGLHM